MVPNFIRKAGTIPPKRLALAVVSGLLLTASFPVVGWEYLAWIALVPLLFAVRGFSPGRSFVLGLVTGCVHYFSLIYWMLPTLSRYGELPLIAAALLFVGLVLSLALFPAVFTLLLSGWLDRPGPGVLVVPWVWVTLEYLRSFLFSGLPWELLGYSQFEHLPLIQVADITGVYGISFLIVWANATVFLLLWNFFLPEKDDNRPGKWSAGSMVLVGLLLLGLTWTYGKMRLRNINYLLSQAPTMVMSIIQGNVDQAQKWEMAYRWRTVEKYMALAEREKAAAPRLVIFPETAMPFYFIHDKVLTDLVQEKAREMESCFLVGAPSLEQRGERFRFYNSAYLIAPSGEIVDRYDKVHLVPFGEYIPGGDWLPFLEKIVYGAGDFSPGKKGDVLGLGQWRLGVQICYEIIFSDGCRTMVDNGADVLLNITNDAWYGRSSAPYQHFSMTVLRAVESRRALVRAANTGISGWVEPTGRIRQTTGLFTEITQTYRIPKLETLSLYTRVGDLFAKICVVITVCVIGQSYRRRNRPVAS